MVWVLGFRGFRVSGFGVWVLGFGFRVLGFGALWLCRVLGFGVPGLGFGAFWLRIWGLGFGFNRNIRNAETHHWVF